MHLGYHELRNMLSQFRTDREARKNAPAPIPGGVNSTPLPPAGGASSARPTDRDRDRDRGGGYRLTRERDQGRDRGYDRDRFGVPSRHE